MNNQFNQYKNPIDAFNAAIERGDLNTNESSEFYAGKWMYMYSTPTLDVFKNIETRNYIKFNSITKEICHE